MWAWCDCHQLIVPVSVKPKPPVPGIGSGVVVQVRTLVCVSMHYNVLQSLEEKQLQKQIKKEGKREERRAKKEKQLNQQDEQDHVTHLRSLGYDPHILRKERWVWLLGVAICLRLGSFPWKRLVNAHSLLRPIRD